MTLIKKLIANKLVLFAIALSAMSQGLCNASYQVVEDQNSLKIKTPSLSELQTEKIILRNKLCVLLISDPKATESSAAIGVFAGSCQDYPKYPGTAHLLEHMLFKGNHKYPEEGGFQEFVTDHGGSYNAFTAAERTAYGFSINNSSFEQGLDRFAQFFIAPSLDFVHLERELQVIDQEYMQGIENDNRRQYSIFKELGNPAHPHSKFSTGNVATLGSILREELSNWHKEHYSADLMRLVVYSNLPLAKLRKITIEKFEEIPNYDYARPIFTMPLSSEKQKGHLLRIEPVMDLKQLSLIWELPSAYINDPSKSLQTIIFAMSQGQKNSLLESLKRDNLAVDIGTFKHAIGNSNLLFDLSIELTDAGVKNYEAVIARCFEALLGLQHSGIPRYLFDEMNNLARIKYEYQSRAQAFSYTMKQVNDLMDEDFASFPENSVLAKDYSPQTIFEILSLLSPNSCQFQLIYPAALQKQDVVYKEKWLGGQYSITPMPWQQLAAWAQSKPQNEIKLPPPNPFMPDKLDLLPVASAADLKHPQKIIDNETGVLYYAQDNLFKTPQIAGHFKIYSSQINADAKSCALKALFLQQLQETLQPTRLSAKSAGLDARFTFDRQSLNIDLGGYSEKAAFFVEEILKALKSSIADETAFVRYKSAAATDLENMAKDLPIFQAFALMTSLQENNAAPQDIIAALQTVSAKDYSAFCSELFDQTYVEALLCGNLSIKEAESIWIDVIETLTKTPLAKDKIVKKTVLELSKEKGPYKICQPSASGGSGLVLMLGEGSFSFRDRGAQQVLAQAIKEAFYYTLRTKQQTAYIVTSLCEEKQKELFQYFALQSGTHPAFELLARFEIFLEDYAREITAQVSKERFDSLRNELITTLSKGAENLNNQAALLEKFAFDYDGDFDWIEKRIESLQKLSYEEFLSFAKKTLSKNNKARLAIMLQGKMPAEKEFSYFDISADDLKKTAIYR